MRSEDKKNLKQTVRVPTCKYTFLTQGYIF